MEPVPIFVAVGPDARLDEFLSVAKSRVRSAVGNQRYLADPPHLTLYVGSFDDPDRLLPVIELIGKLAPPPTGRIVGWHVFRADPLTGGNTPVCRIDAEGTRRLRKLQSGVVRLLSPFRNVGTSIEHYTANWDKLSAKRQRSVEKTGYPFTGLDWVPHFSVASIAPDDWPAAWAALKDHSPEGDYSCPWLRAYRLEGSVPVLLAEHRLTGPEDVGE